MKLDRQYFFDKYIQLQTDLIFDKLIPCTAGLVAIDLDTDFEYNNHFIPAKNLDKQAIIEAESILERYQKQKCIYLANSHSDADLSILFDSNYIPHWHDEWFTVPLIQQSYQEVDDVKQVANQADLDEFMAILGKCFVEGDVQNPYGDIGGLLPGVRSSYLNYKYEGTVDYFILYQEDNSPAAVCSLISYKQMGYISYVGSLPEVRSQGFGKLAVQVAINRSQQLQNEILCVETEKDSYSAEFYKRLGFHSQFVASGFVKHERNRRN